MPLIFFTIVANNYMSYAETLMESVALHHPLSRRFIFLCDELSTMAHKSRFADIVLARDLARPDFAKMAFHYDVMEFSTAIKPPSFLWLFDQFPTAKVIYLDPDIMVAAPLVHVERALDRGSSLVLTPHITASLQDGFMPDDLTIMKSGIYNLGFVAFRATAESVIFLKWWRDRCERDAVVDVAENKFTDQRWVDMAPAFVIKTYILHHASYNLAYWNLAHRQITIAKERMLVNGEPLRFVHFSGVNPGDRSHFSKHQNRFSVAQLGVLRPLFDQYVDRLLAHGWAETSITPYAYGVFESGRKIHSTMRRSFQRHRDVMIGNPARAKGAIFDEGEPSLAALGPPSISRVMYELLTRRPDLLRAFDIQTAVGRENYLKWFIDGGGADAGLDQDSILAAKSIFLGTPNPAKQITPWPVQQRMIFKGTRDALDPWLARPVPLNVITEAGGVPIPRQLAILWETRKDVSSHFPCRTTDELNAFLFWCITDGVAEEGVDLELVAPTLAPYLATTEDEGSGTMAPLTRLTRLSVSRYDGPFPGLMPEAQTTARGRMALALWLVGPASRIYRWPSSFTAKLRDWLGQRAVPFLEGGVPLSNLVHGLWLLREDVREALEIASVKGQLRVLAWVLIYGLREMQLDVEDLGMEVLNLLNANASLANCRFLRFHSLLWATRIDLQQNFPVYSSITETALIRDLAAEIADDWSAGSLLARIVPQTVNQSAPSSLIEDRCGGILLTGLLNIASGRSEDVRMTAAALRGAGMPFTYLDRISGQYLCEKQQLNLAGQSQFEINIVHTNADTALADHLFLRRAKAARAYTIGYWAWELSVLPSIWANAFAFYDEIWTSTKFAYQAIFDAATSIRSSRSITLMPMAVEMPNLNQALSRADFCLPQDCFVFYFGFDLRSFISRKNPAATINAFCMAFPSGSEKVALLIKTLGGKEMPEELALLRNMAKADSRIIVYDVEYSQIELATLVSLCDCFVSLHRSEGFGRGPAEAMLLGKPVIATNYSGNTDFMNTHNSLLVDYKLIPLVKGDYPGWEKQLWADADLAHAAEHMKHVATDPAFARRIGKAGSRFVMQHHNAATIGLKMKDRLDRIVKTQV